MIVTGFLDLQRTGAQQRHESEYARQRRLVCGLD